MRRSHRYPALAALFVAAVALAAPAAAQFASEMIDTFDAPSTLPQLFLDPFDGAPHVAYTRQTTAWHAWLEDGVWSSEAIGEGSLLSWAVGPAGRPAAVYRVTGNSLVCARRDAGGWSAETIVDGPGLLMGVSLAIDPATDRPIVAWTAREPAGQLHRLVLARRTADGWQTSVLDTASAVMHAPSLALDESGAPRLALFHARGLAGGGAGVWYGEASSLEGPFAWTLVDAAGNRWVSLALDPTTGRPRMAYTAAPLNVLRYAWRDARAWSSMEVYRSSWDSVPWLPSLALGPAGDPRILHVHQWLFEPMAMPDPPTLASCAGFPTSPPQIMHFQRAGATGTGPFTRRSVSGGASSERSLAAFVTNESRVVYRIPELAGSPPCLQRMFYATDEAVTGVPILEPPSFGLAIGPNPLPPGSTLTVAFRLAREADVTLELFDLAGRRVARSVTRLGAGPRSLSWAPGDLRSGVYRLAASTSEGTLGRRSLVVAR